MADVVGVVADPKALVSGEQVEHTDTRGAGRVPGERHTGGWVEGGQAGAVHGTGTGRVTAVGIVHPAVVAAGVDGGAGDGNAPERVVAGEVDPRRLETGADCVGLPPGCAVASDVLVASAERAARRHHGEVAAV